MSLMGDASLTKLKSDEIGHSLPSIDGPKSAVGLIATMTRSGTWYNNLVYNFYLQLCMGKETLSLPPGFIRASIPHLGFGVKWLAVTHMCCPGFHRFPEIDRGVWDRLCFHADGFEFGKGVIPLERRKELDPAANPNVRIIYCCRNPLDWAVSAYAHGQKHRDERQRCYRDQQGQCHPFRDPVDFAKTAGLDSFIKQYFTFKTMKARYSRQIKLVHYEDMVRHPEPFFVESLEFLGHDIHRSENRERLRVALQFSSKQNVKALEEKMGHSIADDQVDGKESHIRSGAVGQWKIFFTENDVEHVRSRLAQFNIALDDFVIQ